MHTQSVHSGNPPSNTRRIHCSLGSRTTPFPLPSALLAAMLLDVRLRQLSVVGKCLLLGQDSRATAGPAMCHHDATVLQIIMFPSKSDGMFVPESLIFRSDSNGEDLEGYAGAGLYDSITMDQTKLKKVDYNGDRYGIRQHSLKAADCQGPTLQAYMRTIGDCWPA